MISALLLGLPKCLSESLPDGVISVTTQWNLENILFVLWNAKSTKLLIRSERTVYEYRYFCESIGDTTTSSNIVKLTIKKMRLGLYNYYTDLESYYNSVLLGLKRSGLVYKLAS